MITKHIIEFLKDNNRLIIPELGAFIVKINKEDNSKTITFNDVIKFNDNTFANYICLKENIAIEESTKQIVDFVNKSANELLQGKQIKIEDIGSLFKDTKGYINFSSKLKEEVKNTKKEVIELIDEDIPSSSTNKEEKIAPSNKPIKEEEIIELINNDDKKEIKQEKIKKEEKKEVKLEKIAEPKKEIKKETKPKAKKAEKQKSIKEKKKSNKLLIILIIIGAVLIILTVLGFIFKKQVIEFYDKTFNKESVVIIEKEEIIIEENIAIIDSTNIEEVLDSTIVEETLVEEPKKEIKSTQSTSQAGYKFHVIGGSFQSKVQANKFVQKLKSKGYNSKIVNVNNNGMHRVSFDSYKSKSEAKIGLNNIKANGSEAWILNY